MRIRSPLWPSSEKRADWIGAAGLVSVGAGRSSFARTEANSAAMRSRSACGVARQDFQSKRKNWWRSDEPSRVSGTGGKSDKENTSIENSYGNKMGHGVLRRIQDLRSLSRLAAAVGEAAY